MAKPKTTAMTPESTSPGTGKARLVVQRPADIETAPADAEFLCWARAALERQEHCFELLIRLVDQDESRQLNHSYRDRDHATNVLSFPAGLPNEIQQELESTTGSRSLGDLVLCAPVVEREAAEQGKPLLDHWAHMVIHGILHLLGYSHEEEDAAAAMEQLEIEVLDSLGIPDPY